ncbi:DNA polymerase Y family protein [Sphingobacterium phlebotomi]|uniref:DNA polymerase Y family protein n=2 Tax=Sphingobacterium phlebotomi TaxID=2605433 RepID=A0A5D4H927_9SPHI|nr:DNA polymerase Y family protein [Sphingobacterium phlebotomi]
MAKRYAVLWFPFLLTDWYTKHNPSLADIPFVFAMLVRGRMCVSAVNPLAAQLGVVPNMVVADARAAIPRLEVLPDKPLRKEKLLQGIGLWCMRYTPIVSVDTGDFLILDITGCAHLWGGEKVYLQEIHRQIRQKAYEVRIGIASTIGAAWAIARYGQQDTIIPDNAQDQVLSTMPIACLRLESNLLERLKKLGFRTVASVTQIPSQVLKRRFGEDLTKRMAQALGKEEEYIAPLKPVIPYAERVPCLEPIKTAKGIEIAIEKLLVMLCKRLMNEGKGLRKAKLSCYRVDGKVRYIEIGTNRASAHAKHLLGLFKQKIPTIAPGLGIEIFVLEALKVEDAIPVQELLWNGEESLDNDALAELLDRFKGRDAACCINRFLPDEHYWPERSIRLAISLTEKRTTAWRTDRPRPTRLLNPPHPIEVSAPIPDYPPMLFRYKGEVHLIKKADGPERIEREWWIEQGEHRDYYYVEDNQGRRYWLFRLGHYQGDRSPNWYLHGFFA